MTTMASRITRVSIVYSTVCLGADQRKHQSSASLIFVRGIHRWPVVPLTLKIFPFDYVIMSLPLHHYREGWGKVPLITGFVRGTTRHRWIPLTKGQSCGDLMFVWKSCCTFRHIASDLRRHDAEVVSPQCWLKLQFVGLYNTYLYNTYSNSNGNVGYTF